MAYDLTQYLITRDADGSGGVIATPSSDIPTVDAPDADAPKSSQLAYLAVYAACFVALLCWFWS
jgi:hypothetical protein